MSKKKDALARKPPVIDAEFEPDPPKSPTGFDFEVAMKTFHARKAANEGKQIDNGSLYAGSAMHYYCKFCGAHTQTVPESHWGSIKTVCDPCKILHEHGLI